MRYLAFVSSALAIAGLSAFVATCGDPQTNAPVRPSVPTIADLVMTGPSLIAPGASGQFGVAVRLSDGALKAPSPNSSVQWTSNNSLLRIDGSGLATTAQ